MSNLSRFVGGVKPPKSIINGFTGAATQSNNVFTNVANGAEYLSGALTANTYATVLTVTGSGEIATLFAYTKDTTSRTVGLQVTIDGTVVFDSVSSSIVTSGKGIIAIGIEQNGFGISPEKVPFNVSLVVKLKSSITETNKVALGIAYRTT